MTEQPVLLQTRRERLALRFICAGEKRLFACHHSPLLPREPASAIVLCHPTGHEYERCHRALRQLAMQLAQAGFHVLRFDYSGTGDSAGEPTLADLALWRRDIGLAIDHLRRETGAPRVALVGLRLGGTLALQVTAVRQDVSHLVLWSPVLDGAALLREWAGVQRDFEVALGYPSSAFPPPEVIGVPLAAAVADEILHGIAPSGPWEVSRVLLIAHDAVESLEPLAAILRRCAAAVTVHASPGVSPWRQDPMEAIVPAHLLRSIVSWLSQPQ